MSNLVLSNLATSWIMDRFQIPDMYSLHITTLVSATCDVVPKYVEGVAGVMEHSLSLLEMVIVAASVWYCYYLHSKKEHDEYQELVIYNWDRFEVDRYFQYHPDFIRKGNMDLGHPEVSTDYNQFDTTPSENSKHLFDDPLFGVSGYISTTSYEKRSDDKTTNRFLGTVLGMKRAPGKTVDGYFRHMVKEIKHRRETDETVLLYHGRYCGPPSEKQSNYISSHFYKKKRRSVEELYDQYMKTYFAPQARRIWDIASAVKLRPEEFEDVGQCPTANFLFYGPTGSGKSSIKYRLAVCLGMHIVSINLLDYLDNKFELFRIFQNPPIANIEDVIFSLEEFDEVIRELNRREALEEVNRTQHTMSSTDNDKKTAIVVTSVLSTNKVTKKDLLDLFQGVVPIKGRMIMATTNEYDFIVDSCHQMTRYGRMTSIEVTYLTRKEMSDLMRYYYKIDPSPQFLTYLSDRPIETPTSYVTGVARELRTEHDTLTEAAAGFEQHMIEVWSSGGIVEKGGTVE